MKFITALVTLASLATPSQAGFDWGAGCAGGGGSFEQNLATAGDLISIGEIPVGKWNLLIKLESTADVDIQLFEKMNAGCEGEKAIIAYQEKTNSPVKCGKGPLGNNEGAKESTTLNGMEIEYSGYYGVDGKVGFEYIKVAGEVTTPLVMKAFAFEAGTAKVSYEWGYTRTPCCLGILPCGPFSFSTTVAEGATVDIGEIIVGKKDLRVDLVAEKDVDVQLFDRGDAAIATCPGDGKAIIAYKEQADACLKGALGNNDDGGVESTIYNAINFEYSGYNGVGGKAGNEYLQLTGVTNSPLMMKAFGYGAGEFEVTYEFYEDPPAGEVANDPSVHWLAAKNNKLSKTDKFANIPEDVIITRRGGDFEFLVYGGAGVTLTQEMITLIATGKVADDPASYSGDPRDGDKDFDVAYSNQPYPASQLAWTFENSANNRMLVKGTFLSTSPIGEIDVTVAVNVPIMSAGVRSRGTAAVAPSVIGHRTASATTNVVVLFDAANSEDAVYTTASNRAEYVDNTEGLVWQGLSDNNNGFKWSFNQFDYANLQIAFDRMFRMPVADRGNPVLVSRHLSYSIGADICYGKWGEGSYTTGRPSGGYKCNSKSKVKGSTVEDGRNCQVPDDWRDSTTLFALHRTVDKPVQYCQCFVYAAITTTIGRALGIPTRPVTTFQSAHDADKNRAIEKFYTVDETGFFNPLESAPTSDSVWSFHVWNEMYFTRPEFSYEDCRGFGFSAKKSTGCADGWQAVDATPQESSIGGSGVAPGEAHYQMGPASIALVKANADPQCAAEGGNNELFGCWDNEFVISEVNSNVHMWLQTTDPATDYDTGLGYRLHGNVAFMSDAWGDKYNTIGLQISTKKKGGISDLCANDKSEDHDCSKELDDVTKYYKDKEDSGPGLATLEEKRLKSAERGDVVEFYKPDVTDEGHRMLRAPNTYHRRTEASTITFDVAEPIGVAPGAEGVPIINVPSHYYSSVWLKVPFTNTAADADVVKCALTVHAVDYTGMNKILVKTDKVSADVAGNSAGSCEFKTHRPEWRDHAVTDLDVAMGNLQADGNGTMDSSSQAYALSFTVTAATTDGDIFVVERTKLLCEPTMSLSSGKMVCGHGRGVVMANEQVAAIAHLKPSPLNVQLGSNLDLDGSTSTTLGTTLEYDCTTVNSLVGVNNGRCNPEYNSASYCYDGGDCCRESCFMRNGGLVTMNLDGVVELQGTCDSVDDATTCIDPAFANDAFVPVYSFAVPADPVAFSDTGGAEDFGLEVCGGEGGTIDRVATELAGGACETDDESDDCYTELSELFCNNDDFASALSDCGTQLIANSAITHRPRCKRTRYNCLCKETWTFKDATYTGRSCYVEDDIHWSFCEIVEGSCDGAYSAPLNKDDEAFFMDSNLEEEDRQLLGFRFFDNCDMNEELHFEPDRNVWTEEIQQAVFAEMKSASASVNLRAMAMSNVQCAEGFVENVHGGCSPVAVDDSNKCADGQALIESTGACITVAPVCAAGELLNQATNSCVAHPTHDEAVCAIDELLNERTDACITIAPTCAADELLNQNTNACVSTVVTPTCPEGQLLNERSSTCITPESGDAICAAGELLNEATNACLPKCASGEALDSTGECISLANQCADDELLNESTDECVSIEPKCAQGMLLDERTGGCESKRAGTYVCEETEVLNERANTCSVPVEAVEECGTGFAMAGGECKFVCGDGRKLALGDDEPCIALADGPDDCNQSVPEEEVVVVEAVMKFDNFPAENMPVKDSEEEKKLETVLEKGIAASLEISEDWVEVVSVALERAGDRRALGETGKLVVNFKVNMPKEENSEDGAKEENALVELLKAADESGSLVEEIKEAAAIEMAGEETAWEAVEADTETIQVEATVEPAPVPDIGDEEDAELHKKGGLGVSMNVIYGCAAFAAIGVVGMGLSCFIRGGEDKRPLIGKGKRASDFAFQNPMASDL